MPQTSKLSKYHPHQLLVYQYAIVYLHVKFFHPSTHLYSVTSSGCIFTLQLRMSCSSSSINLSFPACKVKRGSPAQGGEARFQPDIYQWTWELPVPTVDKPVNSPSNTYQTQENPGSWEREEGAFLQTSITGTLGRAQDEFIIYSCLVHFYKIIIMLTFYLNLRYYNEYIFYVFISLTGSL